MMESVQGRFGSHSLTCSYLTSYVVAMMSRYYVLLPRTSTMWLLLLAYDAGLVLFAEFDENGY